MRIPPVPGAPTTGAVSLRLIVSLWWSKITSVVNLGIGTLQLYFWLKFLGGCSIFMCHVLFCGLSEISTWSRRDAFLMVGLLFEALASLTPSILEFEYCNLK